MLRNKKKMAGVKDLHQMQVAQIYFQFDHAEVYKMLEYRGEAMREKKVYNQIKWEMKIKQYYKKH
jgi:hypothetical protein